LAEPEGLLPDGLRLDAMRPPARPNTYLLCHEIPQRLRKGTELSLKLAIPARNSG
jgi:hypothetical protein